MKRAVWIAAALAVLLLAGCAGGGMLPEGEAEAMPTYTQISQEKAREMMAEGGCVVLDVRRPDEFAAGHIPGAVCIPNETIDREPPEALPDLGQRILIYCRSGRRSKEAAQKLADMGYTDLYEFGGILDWTGEIVSEEPSGETAGEAEAISVPVLCIEAGGAVFYADFEDNSSAEAFIEKLEQGEIELALHDYGSFEKVGPLPWPLPRNDETITTAPGDVILYQGDQITIYYDENTWSFTRLARIRGAAKETLLEVFGDGDVTVRCRLERQGQTP